MRKFWKRPCAKKRQLFKKAPFNSEHGPYFSVKIPAPVAQLVECLLRGTEGHGFDPRP